MNKISVEEKKGGGYRFHIGVHIYTEDALASHVGTLDPTVIPPASYRKETVEWYDARNVEIFARYVFEGVNALFRGQTRGTMADLADEYGIDRTEIGRIIKKIRTRGIWKQK